MVPIPISFSHLWGDRGDPRGGTPPGYGTNHFVGSKSHPLRHQGQIAFTVQLVIGHANSAPQNAPQTRQ